MKDEVERVLRENGLNYNPADFDSSIHSWRCEYPDRYGPCGCFEELVTGLTGLITIIVQEEITSRYHPEFGIEWREDGSLYKIVQEAQQAAHDHVLIVTQRMSEDPDWAGQAPSMGFMATLDQEARR